MTVFLDPRAEVGVPIDDYKLELDTTATGLTIGLVSNGFPDATNLMREVGRALTSSLNEPQTPLVARVDPSSLLPHDELIEVAAQCDAVVTAMGHCGSCTSSTVRDAVNFARLGVPAVGLVSTKFWDSGQFVARSVGMPGIPIARLPYPVAGTGQRRIAEIASEVVADIVRQLGGVHD